MSTARRIRDREQTATYGPGVLAAVAGAALLLGGGLGFIAGIRLPHMELAPANGRMMKPDFVKAVMGKTPEQVIAAVGRPGSVHDAREGSGEEWLYFHQVIHPTSREPIGIVRVTFSEGTPKVVRMVE